jgi:L-aspartate semialdehyde sulfurtransferase
MRTIAEINDRIAAGTVEVWTVAEVKAAYAKGVSVAEIASRVDTIVCGTFEPMESSGAIINLGQTDPPIKIRQCWLDGVPAYAGFGAVDLYLGATQGVDRSETEGTSGKRTRAMRRLESRGGGHVIADLIAGKSIPLRALGQVTDCYPRSVLDTVINKDRLNQFYLYNPRNLYQNFIIGVNGGDRLLYTYLGPLQPRLGNAVYANTGALSPLLNDPHLDCIGIGTRIWLGGGIGYIAWEGTQHFPLQKRLDNGTPIGPAATLALIGDAKQMSSAWVRGCYFKNYGSSLMLGVGIPLPVIGESVVKNCLVSDDEIVAPAIDFAIPRRVRPTFGLFSYAQLKSGKIEVNGQSIRTAPLASQHLADRVTNALKLAIESGEFFLTEPVSKLPMDRLFITQENWQKNIDLE